MKRFVMLFGLSFMVACGQNKKYHDTKTVDTTSLSEKELAIREYQEELNAEFRNPETSPLPDRYRKNFEGLDFFAIDTSYVVLAAFERTPDAQPFLMETTTDRKTTEVVFGIAHFELHGKSHALEIYKSVKATRFEKSDNYLFLPFLDDTNGDETYGGGRYINLDIPEGETIVIDFNRAYNPYCVYNKKYSCPLVPRQNYLKTKVMAGVKDFVKK